MINRSSWHVGTAVAIVAIFAHSPLCADQQSDRTAPPPTLGYYVPKEVVFVEVVATTTTTRKIDMDRVTTTAENEGDVGDAIVERTTISREGTLGLKAVPDTALGMAFMDLPAKALSDNAITVELRDGAMLKSINLSSSGRLGDVFSSVAKFVGSVVPLASIAGLDATTPSVKVTTPCDPHQPPYADQPDTVRLYLARNADACAQWSEMRSIAVAIKKNRTARIDLEWQVKGASGPKLEELLKQLRTKQDEIEREENELAALQDRFGPRLEDFAAGLNLGTASSVETITKVVDLTSGLPTIEDLVAWGLHDGVDEKTADDTIKKKGTDTLQQIWRDTRLVVAFERPSVTGPSSLPTVASDDVPVLFRQSVPLRAQVFVATATDATPRSALRLVADRIEQVVHPRLPVQRLLFKRSVLADRQIALTFDEKGRPARMERSGKSEAAALTASMASAAASFRDEFATSIAKVADIQQSQRQVRFNDLTTRLEDVKKQKELLDGQLQLDSTTANFTAALKQQQAAAEMSQIQAELSLTAAKDAHDQRLEMERLKVSIEEIKQQIELVKARQELERLQK